MAAPAWTHRGHTDVSVPLDGPGNIVKEVGIQVF